MDINTALLEIKYRLGYPTVKVFTEDVAISHFIKRAVLDLSSKAFRETMITKEPAELIQFDPKLVAYIVDVFPYNPNDTFNRNIYETDEFTLNELRLFASGDIQSPMSILQFREQFKYWMGKNFEWDYDRTSGKLFVTGYSDSTTQLTIVLKEYFTIDNLPPFMDNWVLLRSSAYTKQAEGKIRSKYADTIPGAPSDGETLTNESKEEMEKSTIELKDFGSFDFGYRW